MKYQRPSFAELPAGPDRLGVLTRTLLTKRIKMQGFIIFDDYGDRYDEFFAQMSAWVGAGKVKFREDIIDGLENAPRAFIGLLEGTTFGKLVIRVGEPSAALTGSCTGIYTSTELSVFFANGASFASRPRPQK